MHTARGPRDAPLPRFLAGALSALALSALAGCGAGFDATSVAPYAPSDGVQADSGDIRVLNALVVTDDSGTAGTLSAAVVNRGTRPDRLTGVSSPDGSVAVPATDLRGGSAVTLGSGTGVPATLTGLTSRAGQTVTLTFTFERAAPVTLRTLVLPATGPYAGLAPTPGTPALSP